MVIGALRRAHQSLDRMREQMMLYGNRSEERAGYSKYRSTGEAARARGELNAGVPCERFLLEWISVTSQGGDVRCRCRKFVTRGTGAGHHRVIRIIRTTSCDFGQSGYPLLSPQVGFFTPKPRPFAIVVVENSRLWVIMDAASSWSSQYRYEYTIRTGSPPDLIYLDNDHCSHTSVTLYVTLALEFARRTLRCVHCIFCSALRQARRLPRLGTIFCRGFSVKMIN